MINFTHKCTFILLLWSIKVHTLDADSLSNFQIMINYNDNIFADTCNHL